MSSSGEGESRNASLPPERAFVLQFRQAAGGRAESFVGRIEHVSSGRSARFESVVEAVAFITSVLRRQGDEGSNGGGK